MSLLRQLEEQVRRSAQAMGNYVTGEGSIQRSLPRLHPEHLVNMLVAADEVPERTRAGGTAEGYIHLSTLINSVCAREQVLSQRHRIQTGKVVTGGHKVVWRMGRAVEQHVRNSIIGARNRRGVYGLWKCKCDLSEHLGEHPTEARCPRCHHGLNLYHEPQLIDSVRKITGSPDLTLIESGFFLVNECKSMNKEQYDALTAPLADHVIQACGHHRLYQQLGFPVMPEVRILYVRKDFLWGGRNRIYKEYVVDPAQYARQIDMVFEIAEQIVAAIENGTLPNRICRSARQTRAKDCNACATCFQLGDL